MSASNATADDRLLEVGQYLKDIANEHIFPVFLETILYSMCAYLTIEEYRG